MLLTDGSAAREHMDTSSVVLGTAVLALLLVVPDRPWRVLRTVVTIAHEGGHAVTALLVGRRLTGMRLHSDTSGVTLSRGRATGPGMVATAFAGYAAPCLLGLGVAALAVTEWHLVPLVICLVLLVGMLLAIRNVFGFVAIIATGAALVAVTWYVPAQYQQASVSLLAWFLLFGGLRAVSELPRSRRSGRIRESDADILARLTRVPAMIWIGLFVVVAVGSLVASGALLLVV